MLPRATQFVEKQTENLICPLTISVLGLSVHTFFFLDLWDFILYLSVCLLVLINFLKLYKYESEVI